MQSICGAEIDGGTHSSNSRVFPNERVLFALSCMSLVAISALISSVAPIAFSIATVFLFAGPHNWIELRYFLSRLPSKFGPLRPFFLTSFTGVLLLGAGYSSLVWLAREHLVAFDPAISFFRIWIACFHTWLAILLFTRGSGLQNKRWPILAAIASSAGVSLCFPLSFGLALTYLHPLVGVWILDRELKRSRPSWVSVYRSTLILAAIILAGMISFLSGTAPLSLDSPVSVQITRHAGSFLLPDVSTHLLVAVHTFLETLHYGVWLLAIPIVTRAFQRNRYAPSVMPISRASSKLQKVLSLLFIASSLAVLALWGAFLNDYSSTRDLYFTIAVFHILAELPFLLWLL